MVQQAVTPKRMLDANELLTKVVKNNELYVIWKTTLLTGENFELHKAKFKDHDK